MPPFRTQTPTDLSREHFIDIFGGVYERSEWIAEQAWDTGLVSRHNSIEGLHSILKAIVDEAGHAPQLALLRAHPDLAGKLAVSGELTKESAGEQVSAGLDQCSEQEFKAFQSNNTKYKEKFGFPYIFAVKGRNRAEILENFSQRVDLDVADEFEVAVSHVHQIALLRLSDL